MCLISRVVYIEILEEFSILSFINVMRCFIVIWGLVKIFRLDCGINFIGGVKELGMKNVVIEDIFIKNFLVENGCVWIFNLLYVFYFGGVWEWMIGIVWRILDGILLSKKYIKDFIYEVFVIFMVEISVVMNFRLIVVIFIDFDDLFILVLFSFLI